MSNLKEIRTRIASVSSTRQITSAMKMVSAARFRKAQDAIIQIRPYADKLHYILSILGDVLSGEEEFVYTQQKEVEKVLLVVVTSNRGLCGGFNTTLIRNTVKIIEDKYSTQKAAGNLDLLLLGKKGEDYFKRRAYKISETRHDLVDHVIHDDAIQFASELTRKFVQGEYDRIDLMYNQFKNAAVQVFSHEQYLPIPPVGEHEPDGDGVHETFIDYIFEPSKKYILESIVPKSLQIQVLKALLDSNASEHGARMTAMHKATDNATELIKELKLEYNKARQASITNEILEIVSGANALDK